MTQEEFIQFVKDTNKEITELLEKKNKDYTSDHNDAFGNVGLASKLGIVDTDKAIFIRLSDKYARLASFIKNNKLSVEDEKVSDTLKDLIGYTLMMLGYLKNKDKK